MAAVVTGAAALAYRKAVAKARERAQSTGDPSVMPWLQEIVAELPENDADAAPNAILETPSHRKSRLLKDSVHRYDRLGWFVYSEITSQAWFEGFIMLNILLVGAATGFDLESGGSEPAAIFLISLITLVVFTLEVVLKVVAEAREPWRYLTDLENRYFNIFDFSIVIASWAFMIQGFAQGGGGNAQNGGAVGGLRMLRLIRILTFVKNVPQLRVIIAGLVQGMKSVAVICMLLGLIIYMFAILACLIFGDNDPAHFGTVGVSMLTLFQVSTLCNWTSLAYIAWYGCENFLGSDYADDNPSRISTFTGEFEGLKCNKGTQNVSPEITALFFSLYILITSWVVMSLFIGVISMGMFESYLVMKEEERQIQKDRRMDQNSRLQSEGDEEPLLKQKIDVVLNDEAFIEKPAETIFELISNLAKRTRDSSTFSLLITATIIIIGVMIGVDTDDGLRCSRMQTRLADPPKCDVRDETVIIGWIAQAIFTVEVAIKILAEGRRPLRYFTDQEQGPWNWLDFFVVVVGYVEAHPAGAKVFENFPVVILRLLRLIRVFRLAKALPRLRSIVEALISGFSAVGWIFVLILVFNYIVACMCMLVFQQNDPFHFGSLGRSMFTILRLETMDAWEQILYLAVYGCSGYPPYEFTLENPQIRCKDGNSFGYGWVGALIICGIIIIGAYVLPTVLIGIVSIKFDEASRYFDAARELKEKTARVVEQAKNELPSFFSDLRLEACRSLFDQLDADSSLSIDYRSLAPFYHYAFAQLFDVELSPDQCESLYQIMDTDRNADVSFDEFVFFIATLKKIEKRCNNDSMYRRQKFGKDTFKSVKNENRRTKWNSAMARANHESLKLAWDAIFASLNGVTGDGPREKALNLFKMFNSDSNTQMDEEEFAIGLNKCGCHMSTAQVHAFVAAVDTNGDGELDFDEFLQLIETEFTYRDKEKQECERREAEALVKNHMSLSPRLIDLLRRSKSPDDIDFNVSVHTIGENTNPEHIVSNALSLTSESLYSHSFEEREEGELESMRDLVFPIQESNVGAEFPRKIHFSLDEIKEEEAGAK